MLVDLKSANIKKFKVIVLKCTNLVLSVIKVFFGNDFKFHDRESLKHGQKNFLMYSVKEALQFAFWFLDIYVTKQNGCCLNGI